MEPKFLEMSDHYKSEIRRFKDKLVAQEKLLAQNEEHAIQLRQRLIQVRQPHSERENLLQ